MHHITTKHAEIICNVFADLLICNFSGIILICSQICQHISHRLLLVSNFLHALQSIELSLGCFRQFRKNAIEDHNLLREHGLKTVHQKRCATRTSTTCSGSSHKNHICFLNRMNETFGRENILKILLQKFFCCVTITASTTTSTNHQSIDLVGNYILIQIFIRRIDHNGRETVLHCLYGCLGTGITDTDYHIFQSRIHHKFYPPFYEMDLRNT